MPDHDERNHLGIRLAGAKLAHRFGRRLVLVRLAADWRVALHAAQIFPPMQRQTMARAGSTPASVCALISCGV